ncbi:MAG: hypothetical protein KKE37_02705 [Verrucomicrobia bacterium]|nr:hypothetical protein [Verrucomicrobiota bacterium]MBU4428246.1 hypothetical protein [Verrucomicrobiota bacterium]MCG2679545.1 hypothetical protein [Kiritimatiellia bacterium]
MEALNAWWAGLTTLNHGFYIAALFFSAFFLWQLIMAVIGLGAGDTVLDSAADHSWEHDSPADAHDTMFVFKLLSIRSLIAFATLFSWAGALYIDHGIPVSTALTYALIWGLAAMVVVSLLMHLLRRMTETGNMQIDSCLGSTGSVHLDIPVEGMGEIRVACSGVMTHFRARTAGGKPLKAGAEARVVKVLGPNIVEVVAVSPIEGKDNSK